MNASKQDKHQNISKKLKKRVDASIARAQTERGLVLVFTGNGKGKSTAAFGTVTRAVGHGYQAAVAQFIKGKWACGERDLLIEHGVDFAVMGTDFTWETQDRTSDIKAAKIVWQQAKVYLENPKYHVVVLDEITYMLGFDYLDTQEVLSAINARPENQSVIITGRGANKSLREIADTVSEIKEIKHAFTAGIKARKGIDW